MGRSQPAGSTRIEILRFELCRRRLEIATDFVARAAARPRDRCAGLRRSIGLPLLKECVAMDIPHELRDEFPQEISLIERMIRTNYEFRRLAERYDEVNRNIYRIESGEEPTTDEVLARLKKWRLKFKDEIAAILTKLEHRM